MKLKEGKISIDIGNCDEPGLMELSVSKAKRWRHCQQSHDYKYVDKLTPKVKARPLTLGGLVHECLEARALGNNWVQAIKDFKAGEWSKLFEEERVELGDIPTDAYRIMRGYHYFYMDTDKRYETIAAEVPFRIRVPGTMIVLVGIIDLIVREIDTGYIWCFEHKTAKKDIPTEEFRMTDVQTTLYIYAMEKMAPTLGYDPKMVKGVMLDYLKTKAPTIPEVLKNGELSKRKITCDYYTYLDCIKQQKLDPSDYEEILEYMKGNIFYRRIPLTKSAVMTRTVITEMIRCGKQIMAISGKMPTRNLNWTCDRPRCEYRDLCIADIEGLDTETIIKLNFDRKETEEVRNGKGEDESE